MIKKGLLGLLALIVVCIVSVVLFISTSPQFGQLPAGDEMQAIRQSPNFNGEVFENLVSTNMDMSLSDVFSILKDYTAGAEDREPSQPIPTDFYKNVTSLNDSTAKVTWYGHSAVLLVMDNKKILLDPMLGDASAPVPFLTKRFPYQNPIPINEIGYVDFVVISHDHYDHLDMPTIMKLKDNVGHFYTALGVESHLMSWGIPREKITSLDWWQSSEMKNLMFVATPARHFSGRGITDRNKTQWASWVIKGKKETVYFSGDGGYADHFQKIGEKYGPIDFAMLECGQYNRRWAQIHMTPEETAQAAVDLRAKKAMPIHWGAFNLSLHSWTDPIERVKVAAENLGVSLVHPVIGQTFSINENPIEHWWLFDQ